MATNQEMIVSRSNSHMICLNCLLFFKKLVFPLPDIAVVIWIFELTIVVYKVRSDEMEDC